MSSINVQSVRISELASQLPGDLTLFEGGRADVSIATLSANESAAVMRAFDDGVEILRKVSPNLYADIVKQRSAALTLAQLAKGTLSTTGAVKQITYPSQVGTIGVTWLTPQAIRYALAPSATYPAYTDYLADTWNLNLTAGQLVNLLGSATITQNTPPATPDTVTINNRYQACPASNQHEFFFVFQNGVVEIGSSPGIEQWHIETAQANKYGIYTTIPINEQTIEANKTIYQYNTLGIVPVYFDMGINWYGLARVSQTSTIKLLGMVFYEHGLFPTVQYI